MRLERFALALLCACSAFAAGRVVDAVKTGDRATALTLLQQKADVNAAEPDGTTAIAWAVREDDLDMADRLIRAGADIKAANRYGVTPLSLACINGDAAMIEKLLKGRAHG
jgi:ankyrin repeat protein